MCILLIVECHPSQLAWNDTRSMTSVSVWRTLNFQLQFPHDDEFTSAMLSSALWNIASKLRYNVKDFVFFLMPMLVKNSYFHQHYVCFATFHIWKRPQCVCLCVCVCRDRLFIRYYLSLFYFYFLPVFSPFLFIIFINIPCSPIYEVTVLLI